MSLIAKDKGKARQPIPVDIYPAVCEMVVDLGLQDGGQYPDRHTCHIRFQIPSIRREWKVDEAEMEGPATVGMFETVSLHKKSNLRPILESWRGRQFTTDEAKAFDLFSLLGKPCRLSITHKQNKDDETVAIIGGIMPLGKGQEAPVCESDPIGYSRGSTCVVAGIERPEDEVYSMLPEWLQKKIDAQIITTQASPAKPAEPEADTADGDDEDAPPF